MKDLDELPHNAVSKLTLNGLATDSEQSAVPLYILPGKRIPAIIYHCPASQYNNPAPPKLPPCDLSLPGDLHLELTLSEMISDGADGAVYSCAVNTTCSAATSHYIPPLAIKIAMPYTAYCAAREAWFYDKMESLQGVLIPRCYGFFVAEVSDNLRISAWNKIDNSISQQREAEQHDEFPFAEPFERTSIDFNRRLVSILVLEKLGPHYPVLKQPDQDTHKDFLDMFEELESIGIIHWDIRPQNILALSSSPNALPGLRSSYAKRVYHWRIIDFCRAARTRATAEYTRWQHLDMGLETLLEAGEVPGTPMRHYC